MDTYQDLLQEPIGIDFPGNQEVPVCLTGRPPFLIRYRELNTLFSMAGELTDEELMCNYRDGNAGAFELLYSRHKCGLYRYLLRKCGSQNVAEELFQDVWLKLIKSRARYEVRAKFSTWLYQLAHNHTIDYYRRHKVSAVTEGMENENCRENLHTGEQHQPDSRTEVQQQVERLLQLLDQLPPEQREVFTLREEAGFSIDEIARITGVNRETAKSRLRYAVYKLRKGLEDE